MTAETKPMLTYDAGQVEQLGEMTLYFADEALVGLAFGDFSQSAALRLRLSANLDQKVFEKQKTPASQRAFQ